MEEKIIQQVQEGIVKANENYGFNFNINNEPAIVAPYDNGGACAELKKDMLRGDELSIKFIKDKDGYSCAWVETKHVAPFKVRLNPEIFSWIDQYIETGKSEYDFDSTPMEPIKTEDEQYKVNILKLFVNGGKKIQWTPLFRERNGKLSGTYIARNGKVFFYVNHTEELLDWLREMKQAI